MITYTARRFHGRSLEELALFLNEELAKVAASFTTDQLLHLEATNVAPTKPREGDIRKADGTNWNPGGTGAGIYHYLGGAWVKL